MIDHVKGGVLQCIHGGIEQLTVLYGFGFGVSWPL